MFGEMAPFQGYRIRGIWWIPSGCTMRLEITEGCTLCWEVTIGLHPMFGEMAPFQGYRIRGIWWIPSGFTLCLERWRPFRVTGLGGFGGFHASGIKCKKPVT